MRVSEERLAAVLTRSDHARGLIEANPVAALILESMAATHHGCSEQMKDTGAFFLDLLQANEPDGTRLTLPIAMQVLARDEAVPIAEMRAHLARVAGRDLLLGLSIHALVPHSGPIRRRRHQRERDAAVRILYLLIKMFEAQEEADALDRAFLT